MEKLKFIKLFFLLLGIIGTGVFLSSDNLVKLYYIINKDKYQDDFFEVSSHSYIDNPNPNIQRWVLYGKLRFSDSNVNISAADLTSVDKINNDQKLATTFPVGSIYPVKVKSGKAFNLNGRNLKVLPANLTEKISFFWLLALAGLSLLPFLFYLIVGRVTKTKNEKGQRKKKRVKEKRKGSKKKEKDRSVNNENSVKKLSVP